MSRELTPRFTRFAKDRAKAPPIPRANQEPSPARGFDVASFAGQQGAFNGPALWAEIHRRALVTLGNDSEFIASIAGRLPCSTCRPHWLALLDATPPIWGPGYFGWTVAAHNEVNRRLGKPEVTEAAARALWAEGIN